MARLKRECTWSSVRPPDTTVELKLNLLIQAFHYRSITATPFSLRQAFSPPIWWDKRIEGVSLPSQLEAHGQVYWHTESESWYGQAKQFLHSIVSTPTMFETSKTRCKKMCTRYCVLHCIVVAVLRLRLESRDRKCLTTMSQGGLDERLSTGNLMISLALAGKCTHWNGTNSLVIDLSVLSSPLLSSQFNTSSVTLVTLVGYHTY